MKCDFSGKRILVLGSNSDIAMECCRCFVKSGANLWMVSRQALELERNAADLAIRNGADIQSFVCDFTSAEAVEALMKSLPHPPDGALLAFGDLPDQSLAQNDRLLREKSLNINFVAAAHVLEELASMMEARGQGWIAVISSVAGDRGRGSNYVYGAAKAGLTAYVSGIRNRLMQRGIHVLTVKPGFVRTKMTHGLPLPGLLCATPSKVADDIVVALRLGRNEIYTPSFWALIMLVIKLIPEGIFKRLKL